MVYHLREETSTSLAAPRDEEAVDSHEVTLGLSFSKPNKPSTLSCSSQALPYSPFTAFVAL